MQNKILISISALFLTLFLTGCDSAEERAEKHFQSAMELLAAGDEERAIVEFRNVFQLDGQHRDARYEFATLQRARGDLNGAFGQYLRLVEQYPNDFEAHVALAEISVATRNWEQLKEHSAKAMELAPENETVQRLRLTSDYQIAVQDGDDLTARQSAVAALEWRAQVPEDLTMRQIIIDDLIRRSEFSSALSELDEALNMFPENADLYQIKLSILGQLRDNDGIEDLLVELVDRFPENFKARDMLVRWFVSQGNLDSAEQYLRNDIDPNSDDPAKRLTLVTFLAELRGNDAALAELDRIIDGGNTASVYRALRAGLWFETGDRDGARAELEALLSDEGIEDKADIRVALARMHIADGNAVGARALIEETLADDSTKVEALKLKSNWLIDDDLAGEAIVVLRSALDFDPADAEIMTLMARAHDREGNQELVGEMLSLAVDASGKAPEESLRYANYLQKKGKFVTAEEILIDSLRRAPGHLQILSNLGQLYLDMEDWSRAEQVVGTLERIESPEATRIVPELRSKLLQAQDKQADYIEYLGDLAKSGEAGLRAHVAIIRNYLENNDLGSAKSYSDELLASDPMNPDYLFVSAGVSAALGDFEESEQIYRDLLNQDAGRVPVWMALIRLSARNNSSQNLIQTTDEALVANPNHPTLLWVKAGHLERAGDIQGAIEIYQGMYQLNSSNLIIANNLASLLASVDPSQETLDRAYTIAKRLRGSDVPAFQDTFGWISLLRGDADTAVKNLELASLGLASDPEVQFHLAKAYLTVERNEDALQKFVDVIGLVTEADTRKFVVESRAEIARLENLSED